MAWFAATFHDQLRAGTELAIFKEPRDPQAPDQLPASVDLGIDFPEGVVAVIWVRDVIGSEAVASGVASSNWVVSHPSRWPWRTGRPPSCYAISRLTRGAEMSGKVVAHGGRKMS